MNFPFFIAKRYLFSSKPKTAVNIISFVSMMGVITGTAALVLLLSVSMEPDFVVIKAIATKVDVTVESFGESTPENTKQSPPYHSAMAEKRALSRAVLKITGFYKYGVYGEDESDDFKRKVKEAA